MRPAKFYLFTFIAALLIGTSNAQEFPIAVGSDNTFGGGAAFDGTHFLFAIQGDASNRYSMNAQLVSTSGTLIGSTIALGHTGSSPMVAFDGTNFLVAWTDSFPTFGGGDTNGIGNVYGQFVSQGGNLVGTPLTLATDVNVKWGKGRGVLTFQDTTYFLTYTKGPDHYTEYLYGQRIDRSGNLVGSALKISEAYAREVAIAFDGTKYLIAWCRVDHPSVDRYIYGQFVSPTGDLVGGNFLIDGGDQASDNPVSMTFDGSNYWVAFHEQAADLSGRWNLFARFVSPSGVVAERFTICDSSKSPTFASAGFDGTNYLITWMEFAGSPRVRGRFFSQSGIPVDTAFTVFDTLGGKFPIGGVGGFVNGKFLLSATRTDMDFTDGDIYGMFLASPLTGVLNREGSLKPGGFGLSQNYPNPFNPRTTIIYSLSERCHITLSIYSVLGQRVATLADEEQEAGSKSVEFDASELSSGMYFYRLQAGALVETKKMVVAR